VSTIGDLEAFTDRFLDAARAGDGDAFRQLVAPHLRVLHVHCYRMLGSYADAEDAMQDSLLRAWRGLAGYEGRSPLRNWLYRITTTTCLKMINRRARESLSMDDVAWLQPYPDALLDQLVDFDADPAAVIDRRESVALGFIAALQVLPGTQRAVLILRDVLAWPSRDIAELLETTVAGVNSALQRARATLAQPPVAGVAARPFSDQERRVIDAFMQAWARCDVAAIAALLRDDAILTMPPQSFRIVGRDDVAAFFATVPADGRLDLIRLIVTRANGHPTLAAYLPHDSVGCRGYGIMVVTVTDEAVATITGFPDPDLFPLFDLPVRLEP